MKRPRVLAGLTVLAMGCAGVWLAAPLAAQEATYLPADIGDLSNAQFLIVKDSAGATVLRGRLVRQPPDGDQIEREGDLTGTGAFAKAKGSGEVEVTQVGERLEQEVELSVEGLPPNTLYTVFVDAKQVGTFTTNERGEAELELETAPVPAKP